MRVISGVLLVGNLVFFFVNALRNELGLALINAVAAILLWIGIRSE